MAHAEASARTVDAAVTAAAAQLGLRSDQVDVEVIEEPVPSTFGYIGTPARVRVTPRETAAGSGSAGGSVGASAGPAAGRSPAAGSPAGGSGSGTVGTGSEQRIDGHPSTQEPSTDPNFSNEVGAAAAASSASAPPTVPVPAAATETGNGQVSTDRAPQPADQSATQTEQGPGEARTSELASEAATGSAGGVTGSAGGVTGSAAGVTGPVVEAMGSAAGATGSVGDAAGSVGDAAGSAGEAIESASGATRSSSWSLGSADVTPDADAASAPTVPDATAAPMTSDHFAASTGFSAPPVPSGPATRAVTVPEATSSASSAPVAPAAEGAGPGSEPRPSRPQRRTYKDEPIEPQMVEEDTERAGDFLEGLLDALDVDGDITTWVDEVGGHIDLEGADLDVLIGSNGETLDALQELTRLAVLRQSKRRVRLLIDINGFRARQREQLTSIVRATVEQVIRTREDHEFQPMTPAERKVVHDAVAAIEGVRTESLGEEPNRRVVIRPT